MKLKLVTAALAVLALGCGRDEPGAGSTGDASEIVAPVYAVSADNMGAHLSGDEEVPPRDTRATGQAIFKLSKDGTELHYKLIVANIQNVTQAHIHLGAAGTAPSGNIVVWLYPPAPPSQLIQGRSQGILEEGTITDSDVIGLLASGGLAGLLEAMRAGNTYVNVHTSQFGPGEIRGQVR